MSLSDRISFVSGRPDRPLVVKCTFDKWNKRITFHSARNCSYELLRSRVEQCFSLSQSSYSIAYKDDDGEITDITTESDLTEAIQYFQTGVDDLPVSSAASILSGRSFGSRRITLRVHITVEYDGPSLSDTSSLASMDDYKEKNGSEISLSFTDVTPIEQEQDDDSVTVSSRDTGVRTAKKRATSSTNPTERWVAHKNVPSAIQEVPADSALEYDSDVVDSVFNGSVQREGSNNAESSLPDDPSAVFERLKLSEASRTNSSLGQSTQISAQWLKDQKSRAFNGLMQPADDDVSSTTDRFSDNVSYAVESEADPQDIGGGLALEQDLRGKFYYTYTSGQSSGGSQGYDSGFEEIRINGSMNGDEPRAGPSRTRPSSYGSSIADNLPKESEPIPLHHDGPSHSHSHSTTLDFPSISLQHIDPDIPPEVLQYMETAHSMLQPPTECTECSHCGVLLDSFRYVCSTCGPKKPKSKKSFETWSESSDTLGSGKGKSRHSDESETAYPPSAHRSLSPSSSSISLRSDKPLPPRPPLPSRPLPLVPIPSQSSTHLHPDKFSVESGYELCVNCIQSVGVLHALSEASSAPGSNGSSTGGGTTPHSPEETQRNLSMWRRAAPKWKGHIRHAYLEKVWGMNGWTDVEQEDSRTCSICSTSLTSPKYKCVSCSQFDLCRACYSQVHEIHPLHAFLFVSDKAPKVAHEQLDISTIPVDDGLGERSMIHSGVKCIHCMQDIVGARYHCAICDSVDICSNCESAGLPGDLDAAEGGHESSHIMIKIPYPLNSNEVTVASRRALHLWTDRDAPNVRRSVRRARANSMTSSEAHTVVDRGLLRSMPDSTSAQLGHPNNHSILCKGCNKFIVGTRFQCASCPSLPTSYSLCSSCEPKSYLLHNPMHIFFKLPRPVDRPVASEFPIVPELYKVPAGPSGGMLNTPDPKAYLQSLRHTAALCDRCMERICGEWFHCVYCSKDLCDTCEASDTHDPTHFFLVFKSSLDMQLLRQFVALDDPVGSPPVLNYPVYFNRQ